MAQLMPLPLTVSCFSKIQIGFTFLVTAHLGSPGKGAVKRVWCVCVTRMMCDRLPADVLRIRFTINEQFTEMSSRSVSVLTSAMKKFIVNVGTNDVSAKMSTSHQ